MNNNIAREIKNKIGIDLIEMFDSEKNIKFKVYITEDMNNISINELELSTRPYNCLMYKGYDNIGKLLSSINGMEDLCNIRNMGLKSAREIMYSILLFQYSILDGKEKDKYLSTFISTNSL